MTDIEHSLKTLLAELTEVDSPNDIQYETKIHSDLGLNSMQGLELILLIEERFHVIIPEKALYEIQTFSDILNLVNESAKGPTQSSR